MLELNRHLSERGKGTKTRQTVSVYRLELHTRAIMMSCATGERTKDEEEN